MPFDPVSAAITGGLTLADMFSRDQANKVALANLDETRRNNANMLRMAKAGRTDAYGNKLSFDDALNQWITQLTPEQQSLISAGEREQRLGLTEDAARNRIIAAMQARTGQQARDALRKNITDYGAGGGPSEGATRADLTRLYSQATPSYGGRVTTDRSGSVVRGNANTGMGPSQRIAQILLQARQGALGETGQREQQRQSRLLAPSSTLAGLASGGQTAPPKMPTTAQDVNARSDDAMRNLINVMQNNQQNESRAFEGATKTGSLMPDLKSIASLYTSLNRTYPGNRASRDDRITSIPNVSQPPGRSVVPAPSMDTMTKPAPSYWLEGAQYPTQDWSSSYAWF